MRFLSFHCEYFKYSTTKRSRSKIFEELNNENKENSMKNVVVLLISIEKQDETNPNFLEKAVLEIQKITKQLKVSNIVLLSFAHLFGELSSPEFGLKSLNLIFVMDEKKGSTDKLEDDISDIEGVQSVEVTDVRRAIG